MRAMFSDWVGHHNLSVKIFGYKLTESNAINTCNI